MTIEELYNWAIDNNCENYDVEIQYRDDGGFYIGTTILDEADIEVIEDAGTVIL